MRFTNRRLAILLIVSVAFGTAVVSAGDRARGAEPSAKKDRPKIYDPKADADLQLAAAAAKARRDGTRILLMFGGDWCGWCHRLHALFDTNAEIRKLVREEYVLVPVDLESPHADRLLRRCKAGLVERGDTNSVGYPFLAVLDADGQVVTQQRTGPLEEGDHHDPKKVRDFLARWTAEPLDAEKVLGEALSRAAGQDKRVLLHFGAPWCGWCHRLDDFLAREDVSAVLARDLIEVKVDLDRMKGGKAVQERYRHGAEGGIPWFALLDAKGGVLATSDGPHGNIGYPARSEEIDHFLAMLRKVARRIEPGQVEQIGTLLRAEAERIGVSREH